jgi:hypothetical protein
MERLDAAEIRLPLPVIGITRSKTEHRYDK